MSSGRWDLDPGDQQAMSTLKMDLRKTWFNRCLEPRSGLRRSGGGGRHRRVGVTWVGNPL